MIERIIRAFQRMIASSERDRIEEKLDIVDARLANLESEDRQISTRLGAIHDVNMANMESLEQKMNMSKVMQETIKETVELKFSYVDRTLDDIKTLIRGTCER